MDKKWKAISGKESDIVVSTRVRLARNLADYPFPGRLTPAKEREVVDAVAAVMASSPIGNSLKLVEINPLSETERRAMMERHLISQELVDGKGTRAVLLSEEAGISIMINEEDHLRIQVLGSGLCLNECLKRAIEIDDILDRSLRYAFDENLGYLTKCPTNLGTGIRASVMLHLPALTQSGAIRSIAANAGKLGFAVRGMFGEGSEAKGSLYQISNQMTLGFDEETIVERLSDALRQIIGHERKYRSEAVKHMKLQLEDRVWRSAGTLSYARSISTDEAMQLLSDIRMGSSLGLIEADLEKLNSLLWEIQPANLIKASGKDTLTPEERDIRRAALLRKLPIR
jgi:protein arginine kinase